MKREMEQLVERAAAGEIVTITRWGKPVARMEPFNGHGSPEDRSASE